MVKITLDAEGMACGMCESHINDTIRSRSFFFREQMYHSFSLVKDVAVYFRLVKCSNHMLRFPGTGNGNCIEHRTVFTLISGVAFIGNAGSYDSPGVVL